MMNPTELDEGARIRKTQIYFSKYYIYSMLWLILHRKSHMDSHMVCMLSDLNPHTVCKQILQALAESRRRGLSKQ